MGIDGQKDRSDWIMILDENELARDQSYLALGSSLLYDDEETLAYAIDTARNQLFRVFIKDLKTSSINELKKFDDSGTDREMAFP